MSNIPKIKKLAQQVRKWAEENREVAQAANDLCGMCAIASAKLSIELDRVGIKHQLAYNDYHAFIVCDDHIVDVTATQFGSDYGKVEVVHKDHATKTDSHWNYKLLFDSVRKFSTHIKQNQWPDEQVPRLIKYKHMFTSKL